eukprot:2374797-Ditylum_brightwellii.AAC.1
MIQTYDASWCLYLHYMLQGFWIHALTIRRFGCRNVDCCMLRSQATVALQKLKGFLHWPVHHLGKNIVEPTCQISFFFVIGLNFGYRLCHEIYLLVKAWNAFVKSQDQQQATREKLIVQYNDKEKTEMM